MRAPPAFGQSRQCGPRPTVGFLLAALFLPAVARPAAAQAPELPPLDQKQIDGAVERGVSFLRAAQTPAGTWGTGTRPGGGGGWVAGFTALAGLTLIECGVPIDDPGIQKAAAVVRAREIVALLDSTYEVALAVMFLDRVGDKKDEKLLRQLAARLIAGQMPSGGWGYKVPTVAPADVDPLFAALRKLSPARPPRATLTFDRPGRVAPCIKMSEEVRPRPSDEAAAVEPKKAQAAALAGVKAYLRRLAVLQDPDATTPLDPEGKGNDVVSATTDNSNVHFAIVALWNARRHDVPVERSFGLLVRRFRTSQQADGGWHYHYVRGGLPNSGGRPAMTAIALLGLAVGEALDVRYEAAGPGPRVEKEKPAVDPVLLDGFVSLSRAVGQATGKTVERPAVKAVGGLYFLWAMERVAVLYEMPTLANKDWYRWGAEILLCHQSPDGSWADGGYHGELPVLNACMALMFLRRADLLRDLSKRSLVDPALLAKKVIEKEPAKLEPAPPIREAVAASATPEPTRAATVAVIALPQSEPTPSSSRPREERGSLWPWLIGGLVLVALVAGGGYLAVRKPDEDEERPRKKKKRPAARP